MKRIELRWQEILRLLTINSGRFVSGETIGKKIGVSRSSIWKHVRNLQQKGFFIERHTNLGYRLIYPDDSPLILKEEDFETKTFAKNLLSLVETTSTNDVAKEVANKVDEGTVIISEMQSSGRGRKGRNWISPFGCGLYFSIVLKPVIPIPTIPRLTILAGVCIGEALKKLGVSVTLKWPNDIMIGNKKVGGVLSELFLEGHHIKYVIIGIGINVQVDKKDFPYEIRSFAGSIKSETGKIIPRWIILKEIVSQMEHRYYSFCEKNGEMGDLRKLWEDMAFGLNKEVYITTGSEKELCTILGLKDDGTLLVRTEYGHIKEVYAGEVLF